MSGSYPPGPQQPGGYPPPGGGYGQPPFPPGGNEGYLRGGQVGFGQAISLGLKNSFNYSGRASQSAYWWLYVFIMAVYYGLGIIVRILIAVTSSLDVLAPVLLADLAISVPQISAAVRRLHDSGRSGFWMFLFLIPIFGWITLLVFLLMPGTRGPNRFG